MKLAHASVSARTARAYADCWDHFSAWCETHGAAYLPADPAMVLSALAPASASLGSEPRGFNAACMMPSAIRAVLAKRERRREAGTIWL